MGLETDMLVGLATGLIVTVRGHISDACPELEYLDAYEREGQWHVRLAKNPAKPTITWVPYFNVTKSGTCRPMGINGGDEARELRSKMWNDTKTHDRFPPDMPAFTLTKPDRVMETKDHLVAIMPEKMQAPKGWSQSDRRKHVGRFNQGKPGRYPKSPPMTPEEIRKALVDSTAGFQADLGRPSGILPEVQPLPRLPVRAPLNWHSAPAETPAAFPGMPDVTGFSLSDLIREINRRKREDPEVISLSINTPDGTLRATRTEIME